MCPLFEGLVPKVKNEIFTEWKSVKSQIHNNP